MYCPKSKSKYVGNFKHNTMFGKGILTEGNNEYFVEYNEKGEENFKRRTFEGARIMLGFFFLIF